MKVSFPAIFLSLLISLSLVALPASADEKTKKEQELKALQKKITKLQNTIEVKQDSKSAYVKQLKKIEQSIGKISQSIQGSKKKIILKKTELKALRQQKKKSQQQLSQENSTLGQQVYAAFTLG